MGESIDVYTNGAKAMSVQEADKTGSLLHTFLYVIVVDIIMAVIIVIMVQIYFCKPDFHVLQHLINLIPIYRRKTPVL